MLGEELPGRPGGEQPGPSRRKRQPSMSEAMPLYTLCKEDLESMDKEVRPRRARPVPSQPHRRGTLPEAGTGPDSR